MQCVMVDYIFLYKVVSALSLHQMNRSYVLFVIDIINTVCCSSDYWLCHSCCDSLIIHMLTFLGGENAENVQYKYCIVLKRNSVTH